MQSANRRYIPQIDHLRAYAALLIILYHGFHLIGSPLQYGTAYSYDNPWPTSVSPLLVVITEGYSAVSLFIVLSGFILSHGVLGRSVSYAKFLLARALRIYPMLLLCLVAAVVATGADLGSILASLIPLDPLAGVASPFTAMFWAVKIELQCYLLFPLLLWASRWKGFAPLLGVVFLCLVVRVVAVLGAGADPRDISYWTLFGRLDQFTIGVIAAKWYAQRTAPLPSWLLIPALMIAFTMLFTFNRMGGWVVQDLWRVAMPPVEAAVWSAVTLTYLSFGRLLPDHLSRLLVAFGVISYSAYLLHPVIINMLVSRSWWLTPTGQSEWDAIITTTFLVLPPLVLLATVTFKAVEKPAMALRPKYAAAAKAP